MQTFSSMQRNSVNLRYLSAVFWAFALFSYEILSMTNQLYPPLIGLFFAYCVVLNYEREQAHTAFKPNWYFSVAFLLFAEQLHNFELFSVLLSFLIFYYFIFDYLLENVKFRGILLVLVVVLGYLLVLVFNNLFAYILQTPLLALGYEYALYMVIESLLAMLFFRGRIL